MLSRIPSSCPSPALFVGAVDAAAVAVVHDFFEDGALRGHVGDARIEHLEGEPLGFADTRDGETDEELGGGVVEGV